MKVFTLGTADRQHYDFTKILNKYGIQAIFDVRRTSASPQSPQFSRDSLQRLCASQNTDYIYLGNDLGGPRDVELRPSPDTRGPYDPDLRDWLSSDEFERCVNIIAGKASKRVSCVLCTERYPYQCHRLFLSEALGRLGFEVTHILDAATLWTPPRPRPEVPTTRTRPARPSYDRGRPSGPRRPRSRQQR